MLNSLEGLDHAVVMVRDLAAAASQWRALGFTVSPQGTHSAHMGTGNATIMFDTDYLELLGVLHDTPLNAPSRAFLQRRGEGIERAAFTTTNAAAAVAALHAQGIAATGPVEFSRPVALPNGQAGTAAFSVFHWPVDQRPGDMRLFACQHHTRETVWIAALQTHANTAVGIVRLEIVTPSPSQAAAQLAALLLTQAEPCADGVCVRSAPGRGDFVFLTPAAFHARHAFAAQPATGPAPEPGEGVAALVCRVTDLDAATRCVGLVGQRGRRSVKVPAEHANGVMLVFEAV